jgi:hypothetical protein
MWVLIKFYLLFRSALISFQMETIPDIKTEPQEIEISEWVGIVSKKQASLTPRFVLKDRSAILILHRPPHFSEVFHKEPQGLNLTMLRWQFDFNKDHLESCDIFLKRTEYLKRVAIRAKQSYMSTFKLHKKGMKILKLLKTESEKEFISILYDDSYGNTIIHSPNFLLPRRYMYLFTWDQFKNRERRRHYAILNSMIFLHFIEYYRDRAIKSKFFAIKRLEILEEHISQKTNRV